MFFLTGVARYLFVPLAEAVVFAMLASYLLSRTLVPTMAKYLLAGTSRKPERKHHSRNPWCVPVRFEHAFERFRDGYRGMLERPAITQAFLSGFSSSVLRFVRLCSLARGGFLSPRWTRPVPAARSRAHRAHESRRPRKPLRPGRAIHPPDDSADEISSIIDNIGLPYSGINLSYSTSAPIGPADADILVALARASARPLDMSTSSG